MELKLDAKKSSDDVHKQEILCSVYRHFGDKEGLQEAEYRRRKAMQDKADRLPPAQRVSHLQKRHRLAHEELRKLIQAQAALDAKYNQLQKRRLEHHEVVEDQRDAVEALRVALEQAELDLPPKGAPKPVGRQVQPGDPGDLRALLSRGSASTT